jgi:hypothetical protein
MAPNSSAAAMSASFIDWVILLGVPGVRPLLALGGRFVAENMPAFLGRRPVALARAAKEEVAETKREGKPGQVTAQAVASVAWYAVLAREFTKALTAAERAHALLPGNLSIETNRAHALMFAGRGDEAEAIYLAHKGQAAAEELGAIQRKQ